MSNLPVAVDLYSLAIDAASPGPQWGLETDDLNATLLVWPAGEGVAEHVNDEVDVLIVGVEGEGAVTVDGRRVPLGAGQTILVPKGSLRSVTATTPRFGHLNVHRRRRKLAVGTIPNRQANGNEQFHP
ncbi:cupin domain-containing protein [bacterium]|nr:MAG: cupin domain-containing protein [bacterium]